MHKLYSLRELLIGELEDYAKKDKLDAGSVNSIDTLAHAIKNIDKIIECDESSMSYRPYSTRTYHVPSYRSYANGYSSAYDENLEELRNAMDTTRDERVRSTIAKVIRRMEQM